MDQEVQAKLTLVITNKRGLAIRTIKEKIRNLLEENELNSFMSVRGLRFGSIVKSLGKTPMLIPVHLTLSVDDELSESRIRTDLNATIDNHVIDEGVNIAGVIVDRIKEEAEIYGNT